jgi:L-2,4-diaminobutyric acid acetyltransferase
MLSVLIISILNGVTLELLKSVNIRPPTLDDGMSVYHLIERCPPLDTNSSYCNFLQCGHFFDTSVMAEMDGEIVGFISAYKKPEQPDTLFVWQVAVDEKARGMGMASRMLIDILKRPQCKNINTLETTITEDNKGSWALFKRLAETLSAELTSSIWLDKDKHFDGLHDSEALVTIGPFNIDQEVDK